MTISIVDGGEAEKADLAVCVRTADIPESALKAFTDNIVGRCSECGHSITYRPSMPVTPRKVCTRCYNPDLADNVVVKQHAIDDAIEMGAHVRRATRRG